MPELQTESATLSPDELEAMRAALYREIAGLQIQLEWVEDAIAKLDQRKYP